MERSICIHGHFYQPPRENPWLEAIELQDSAFPYHDWNEKITSECYGTNATSRILNERGQIVRIVNNYARMSFNFGPTLLAWLEPRAPDVYAAILTADREGQAHFSGHGGAIAQPYNHSILPLSNRQDKQTQVLWGVRDFEYRFKRPPEGMWLPETAVDIETLEVLAEHGIAFTILAPHQARRVRPLRKGVGITAQQVDQSIHEQTGAWHDVSGGKIDPTMGYICRLPSRKTITLFFYDGPISRSVAFERLLNRGEDFAHRLMSGFSDLRKRPQLVHIATDGESYGHHHRYGDMALAYALHYIESHNLARLTVYGEHLEKSPPTHEVEISENTSWSCAHGLERWQNDCGCNSGGRPEWNQQWRAPLREALDWLRERLAPLYERLAAKYLLDPWGARDEYINVILARSRENTDFFLGRHMKRPLQREERQIVLKLLELQRHAMLMYTSCGWFFDELSGIETVQIIQYAGRALQLAQDLTGDRQIEAHFVQLLSKAGSNIPEHRNGRLIYENFVKPSVVDLQRVAAHYAVSSLFEEYSEQTRIYCFTVNQKQYQLIESGNTKLALGNASVASEITEEAEQVDFGAIHFGDHNLNCGVRKYIGGAAFQNVAKQVSGVFGKADFLNTVRLLDKHFGASAYSLKSLFRDEQRKILNLILESTLGEAEAMYRHLYNRYAPMMRFLKDSGVPIPGALYAAAEMVLNVSLRRALEDEELDAAYVKHLLQEAEMVGINLQTQSLEFAFRTNVETFMGRLISRPDDASVLEKLINALEMLRLLPFEVNLWKVQNLFYTLMENVYPKLPRMAKQQAAARLWSEQLIEIGNVLSVSIADLEAARR